MSQLSKEIEGTEDPAAKQYLEDINKGLQDEYDNLTKVREETKETGEELKKMLQDVAGYAFSAFDQIAGSLSSIWTNQADNLKAEMDMLQQNGELTEEKQLEMQKKIDEYNRRAFVANQANSIAQATSSYALGVMKIWETYANQPWIAGALTGLVTGAYGTQVASIASQSFTPFAKGGIVTGPTMGLVGEAGPEAIIPLSSPTADRMLSGNGVTINITIEGNAREDEVFYAIERAQRTGLLPNWSR